MTGTGYGSDRTQWSIGSPAGEWRTIAHKECRYGDQESDEGHPERHHVEVREGHVLSANLDRQEVISECGKGCGGEDEEDHDRAMHGHQLQVVFRCHDAARGAIFGQQLQTGNGSARPPKMDSHEPGKHHANHDGEEGQTVILFSDDLVIEAEDVLPDKARRGRVMCYMG